MPSLFDTQFAAVGFPFLLGQFGEPITYQPTAGGERSISAIVERDPPAIFDASGGAVLPKLTIRVLNSATDGISSDEVNIGTDEISIRLHVSDALPKTFSFMTQLSEDSGVSGFALI